MASALPAVLEDKWGRQEEWYSKAVEYWDRQDASVDGVLGGYGHVSSTDISDSLRILQKVRNAAVKLSLCYCHVL